MKKTRFLFSLLMAIVMMAMSPQKMWAIGGSGTSSDPFTIANENDLFEFADRVNNYSYGDKCFKLVANITLTKVWTPIGTSSNPYTGTFDGNNKTISGLNLTATAANAGFFGYVNGATIKNFTLAGTASSAYDNTGSVVGTADGATKIYNVYSSVNITMTAAKSHIGGIAGQLLQENSKVSEIKGCAYSGTMNLGSSTDSNGGIVGYCEKEANVQIEYCFFSGSISSSGSTPRIGGILGYANDENSQNFNYIRNCYCDGTLSPSSGTYVGAIAGYPRGNVPGVITNNTYKSGMATNALGNSKTSSTSTPITISVTAGSNGTVSHSYVNPTTSTPTQLQVVATPNAHYHLTQWSDNGAQTHSVGLTANVSLTASFAIDQHTISVATNNANYGTVSGGGTFDYNSTKTITATPKTHYHFEQWNDGNTNASRTITVTGDKTYTATFAIDQFTITVKTNDSSMGTVSGGGTFDYNSTKTITATPKAHYHFVQWNDGVKTASRQISVTGNATYTATFAIDQHTITVQANNNNYGTVTGSGTYNYGTQQTITATPKEHYHFVQWSDNNTNASRTITVNGNATYTATFAIDQHTISVQANNNNYGTVSGGGTFDYNSSKTITATPKTGYHFVEWNDGNTDASRTITITGNKDYTAYFAPNQYTITVATNNSDYGTVSGGGTFDYGSTKTITATPKTGYRFVEWNDGNTNASRHVTVTGNATYTATFIKDNKAKAVYNDGTLTFYFDNITHSGTTYDVFAANSDGSPEWISNNENTTSVVFDPSFADVHPTTGQSWFAYCNILTSITGLEYLNTDAMTNMNYMFEGCKLLTSLDLSSFNTANVTDMSAMFENCSGLTSLNLSSFNTANVTNISYMFQKCSELTSLNLSSFTTANLENMNNMFSRCTALENLTIGNFDMQFVTNTTNIFYRCTSLKTLTLKSLPFLKDGTFNTQFSGDGKTVNYELDDNSAIYTGANNLPAPATSTATFNRNIVMDDGMYSFIVPFDIPADQAAELGKFYQYRTHEGGKVYFDDITTIDNADGIVRANTAYFFKPAKDITSITVENPTFDTTGNTADATNPSVLGLYGTYSPIEVPVGAYGYVVQDGQSTFVKAGTGNLLRPYRAYLWLGTGASMARALAFFGEEETNGIIDIDAESEHDIPAYDLSGQRVNDGYKGIVIKNGKKTMVR